MPELPAVAYVYYKCWWSTPEQVSDPELSCVPVSTLYFCSNKLSLHAESCVGLLSSCVLVRQASGLESHRTSQEECEAWQVAPLTLRSLFVIFY